MAVGAGLVEHEALKMRAVVVVAWNNLRRRKGQAVLGTVLSLAVLLFFAGVGLMMELDGPFERMFEELEGAHYTLMFDSRIHDPAEVRSWWQGRSEEVAVLLEESAYVAGESLSKFVMVNERLRVDGLDKLQPIEGSLYRPPAAGEVWIPTVIAQETGMGVGDVLEIPAAEGLVPLTVSAVVVDPVYSAPFNSPTRIWIGPGELPYLFGISRLNEVSITVRLEDVSRSDELWDEFLVAFGGHFSGRFGHRRCRWRFGLGATACNQRQQCRNQSGNQCFCVHCYSPRNLFV